MEINWINGNQWRAIKINRNQLKSMEIHCNQSESILAPCTSTATPQHRPSSWYLHELNWKSMKTIRNRWKSKRKKHPAARQHLRSNNARQLEENQCKWMKISENHSKTKTIAPSSSPQHGCNGNQCTADPGSLAAPRRLPEVSWNQWKSMEIAENHTK